MVDWNIIGGIRKFGGVIRRSARYILYFSIWAIGLVALWRYKNRYQISILTFHGVADPAISTSWTPTRHRVETGDLEKCIELLKNQYRFLSIDVAVSALKRELAPPRNGIVLTFDDGYANNFEVAVPILQKQGVPGIFYVATDHVSFNKKYWFDRLDYALQKAVEGKDKIFIRSCGITVNCSTKTEFDTSFAELRSGMKKGISNEREFVEIVENTITELEEMSGHQLAELESDPWSDVVSWDVLRQMSRNSLVSIGSHSVSHTRLSFEELEKARREALASKATIERELGIECRHFAYPNGAFDTRTIQEIGDANYVSAVTSEPGLNSIGSNVHALRRIYAPMEINSFELKAKVCGLTYDLMSLREWVFNRKSKRRW